MKKQVMWTVEVPFWQNNRVVVLTIPTDVRHGENAVAQARMRSYQEPGYDWENAEVWPR
jgi:hypothetical protein